MTTKTNNKSTKKSVLIIGFGLIATIWIATFAAMAIMQPDLKTRMLIMAGGAGATELVIYIGAAWFGVNLYKHIRSKFSSNNS
jgi:hypothetical protein